MNRRHADFQAGSIDTKSKSYDAKPRQTFPQVSKAYADFVKPVLGDINVKSPSQECQKSALRSTQTATALCHAILACDPTDARQIMAVAYADLSIGMPIAPLTSLMDEADFWADLATVAELKAYCLACFTRLPASDQSAFLAYVQQSRAA